LDAACAEYAPATTTELALVRQVVVAQIEIERLEKTRAAIQAKAMRDAITNLEVKEDDEICGLFELAATDPLKAGVAFRSTARRARHLIRMWEQLVEELERDGTWYGKSRDAAIVLQGYPPDPARFFDSEPAWRTWLDCLAAEPHPKKSDIDLI